jgi:hypothetical protein
MFTLDLWRAALFVYGVVGILSISSITPTNSIPQSGLPLPHLRGTQQQAVCPLVFIDGGIFIEFIGSSQQQQQQGAAFQDSSSDFISQETRILLGELLLETYNELSDGLLLGDRSVYQVDFSEPVYRDRDSDDVPFSMVATVKGTCTSCNPNSNLLGRYLRDCSSTIAATFCSDNATLIEESQSLDGSDCDSHGPHASDFANLFISNVETSIQIGELRNITRVSSVSELAELSCGAMEPFSATVGK